MNIKPIETFYDGYYFRSRLEARFAVFCDRCGIFYKYEPEGYVIDGKKYLPDFYLPDMGVHVEVKGEREGYEKEILKTKEFIQWGGPINTIAFVSEIPDVSGWGLPHFPAYHWTTRGVRTGWFFFCQDFGDSEVKGRISSSKYNGPFINEFNLESGNFQIKPRSDYEMLKETRPEDYYSNRERQAVWNFIANENWRVIDAYKAARSARFEHGAKGGHHAND